MFDNFRLKRKLKKDLKYQLKKKDAHIKRLLQIIRTQHLDKVQYRKAVRKSEEIIHNNNIVGEEMEQFLKVEAIQAEKKWTRALRWRSETAKGLRQNEKQMLKLSEKGLI